MSGDRIVFFDVETGGLNPLQHPIIQFAGVAVDHQFHEVEALEVKILFDRSRAEEEALAKNRYDAVVWEVQGVPETVALARIAEFTRRHATLGKVSQKPPYRPYTVARMAAHNARFDGEFVAAWFKRAGQFFPGACFEALCTLHLARWASLGCAPREGPKDHKLESLCEWLGVPLTEAHDALADVRATVEVARILTGRLGISIGRKAVPAFRDCKHWWGDSGAPGDRDQKPGC